MTRFVAACFLLLPVTSAVLAGDATSIPPTDAFAGRGYQLLSTKPYLPPDFTGDVFDELWQTWEEPARSEAAKASPEERRRMAFSRYGLTSAPGDTSGKPQQYIVDAAGNWTMTCLACHQGKVAGQVVPGLPNSLFALQSLADDVRATKLRMHKQLVRMDLGSALFPLGTTNGTTNAVMFGTILMSSRDPELNLVSRLPPKLIHHDHDAPPWWNFKKKTHLYSDGFAAKSPRPLMQFMLIPENGPEKFHEWEADFQQIFAWLESLEPPKYPFEVDRPLAAKGQAVFERSCADCHGTYGAGGEYPEPDRRARRSGHRPRAASSRFRRSTAPRTAPVGSAISAPTIRSPTATATWPRRSTASGPRPRTSTTARCPRCGTCCTPASAQGLAAQRRRLRPQARRPGDRNLRPAARGREGSAPGAQLLRHVEVWQKRRRPPVPRRAERSGKTGRARIPQDALKPCRSAGVHFGRAFRRLRGGSLARIRSESRTCAARPRNAWRSARTAG